MWAIYNLGLWGLGLIGLGVELQEKLKQYVKEALKREEILSFLRKDFSQYQWSIRTLDRRLRYFDIYYSDKNVTVHKVREAVAEEVHGPGKTSRLSGHAEEDSPGT